MAIQYRDGSFSDNMPLPEAMEKFFEAIEENTARALFVGTDNELKQIKKKATVEEQISELEKRISDVEAGPVESENIIIPPEKR